MKKPPLSLRLRIALGMLVVAVPVLVILILSNLVAFRNRQQESMELTYQMASHAVELNTNMLESITSTVGNFVVSSSTIDDMQYLENEADRFFAKQEIVRWMQTSILSQYPDLEMCFAYSTYTGEYLPLFNSGLEITQRMPLREEILQVLQGGPKSSSHWQYAEHQGVAYLECFFQFEQMYFGALLPVEKLDQRLGFVSEEGSAFCLFENGMAVRGAQVLEQLGIDTVPQQMQRVSGGGRACVVMPLALENPAMSAVLVLSTEQSLAGMTALQVLFLLVTVVVVAAVLFLYRLLQKNVTQPVDILVDAMQKVGQSDLAYRIDTTNGAPEFAVIGSTFNQMMDRIQALTAEVYTRQLENQKVRLRNLQMQINPHFLSNCMNVIHAASVPQNWEVVRQMTTYLTSYFRFMNSLSADEVLLEEELRYTRDFLSIQELRFPDKFSWEIAVPDYLGQARIPPLVIKTFVENTIKHARKGEDYVELFIEAEMEAGEGGSRLHLHISDTGPGFAPELLARWQTGEPISPDGVHHIGLDNIRSRLQLAYGAVAGMTLENPPEGGAAVHLYIPLDL